MGLRANDADGYKSWLAIGIEELGRDVAGEVESEWMVPLLVEEERGPATWGSYGERRGTRGTRDTSTHQPRKFFSDQDGQTFLGFLSNELVKVN